MEKVYLCKKNLRIKGNKKKIDFDALLEKDKIKNKNQKLYSKNKKKRIKRKKNLISLKNEG